MPDPVIPTAPTPSRLADLVAGVSIAGLLLPEAVAYSSIGNLPAQAGVVALLAGLVCYGLIGRSRFAVVAATSSSAALLAASTLAVTGESPSHRLALAMGLILVTGVFFVVAAAARLGGVSDFIAKPVLRGFAFGLAITIIVKQLPKMVGVHPQHADLPRFAYELFSQLPAWNGAGLALGAAALVLLVLVGRFRRLPGALLVLGAGIALGQGVDLHALGIEVVGVVHLQLEAPTLPALNKTEWLRLGELGFAMGLILYAESYGAIRSFALKHGDTVSPNRDLLALGVANLASGLLQGMPVGAGYSATSANEAAGAQSRLSGWVAAATVLLIVATLLPVLALTPEPVLAAVVVFAVGHTLNPAVFKPYFAWRRDRLVAVAAVLAVLWLGVLDGLLVAMGISLLTILQRQSESNITVLGRLRQGHDFVSLKLHADAQQVPGMLILRPESPLFFANVERVVGQIQRALAGAASGVTTVIISLEESSDIDGTTIEALGALAHGLAQTGRRLLLTRLKEPVVSVLVAAGLPDLAESQLVALSVDDAVQQAMAWTAAQATTPLQVNPV